LPPYAKRFGLKKVIPYGVGFLIIFWSSATVQVNAKALPFSVASVSIVILYSFTSNFLVFIKILLVHIFIMFFFLTKMSFFEKSTF